MRVTRGRMPASYTCGMSATLRPEAIDSRLVFRTYACITLPAGIGVYMWPLLMAMERDVVLWFAPSPDRGGRRGGCRLLCGGVRGDRRASCARTGPSWICSRPYPVWRDGHPAVGGGAVADGSGVRRMGASPRRPGAAVPGRHRARRRLHAGSTGAAARCPQPGATTFALRNKPAIGRLRSAYEEQIRQAARQEERARLARDLHDAVKQQLFVIQTAGATAQARLSTDIDGARAAVDQVRAAAREAMTEMEVMLDQLQGAPIENAGLLAFLKKHCEALGFRTGAEVTFDAGRAA